MPETVATIAQFIEEIAPLSLAYEWDNVGLQIGDPDRKVSRILVALDVNDAVVKAALAKKAELLVTHHPLIFHPMKRIVYGDCVGRFVAELIRSNISLYCAHTNLDKSPHGTNKALADLLGVENTTPIEPEVLSRKFKLVIFVPEGHEQQIIDAIHRGGGGIIGDYTHCTFGTYGTGTFLGGEAAKPFIGSVGNLERVREIRMETVVDEDALQATLDEVLAAHPYEEPAYDIYPLKEIRSDFGLGCVGELKSPVSMRKFIQEVKSTLKIKSVRYVGDMNVRVKKVALCPGAGEHLIEQLSPASCDVFVTGDLKYHAALEAKAKRLNVLDAGHFATEIPIVPHLAKYLREQCKLRRYDVDVSSFTRANSPFKCV